MQEIRNQVLALIERLPDNYKYVIEARYTMPGEGHLALTHLEMGKRRNATKQAMYRLELYAIEALKQMIYDDSIANRPKSVRIVSSVAANAEMIKNKVNRKIKGE